MQSIGVLLGVVIFFFKQKTAYEMRISDWSSDVCSSDLGACPAKRGAGRQERAQVLIQLVNVLRTLGGFREFGKSELFPRSWPVPPRGNALRSFGSRTEGERAHPVITRSKNKISIAGQAVTHCLVHEVLAPTVRCCITDSVEDGKALFRLVRAGRSCIMKGKGHRIDSNPVVPLKITASIGKGRVLVARFIGHREEPGRNRTLSKMHEHVSEIGRAHV